MNKIKLNSRDNSKNYLVEVAPNTYKLESQFNYRVGYDENNILFVDPSGGPFISTGFKTNSKVVTNIYRKNNELLIELQDDIPSN